jgi:hypothetical protein
MVGLTFLVKRNEYLKILQHNLGEVLRFAIFGKLYPKFSTFIANS